MVISRKEDPAVRIRVPFDKDLFDSTLAVKGKKLKVVGERVVYGIESYSALNSFLGENWHFRVNDVCGDFFCCPRVSLLPFASPEALA